MFFSRKNKGGPFNVLLLYHGVAGQGIASFKAFPGPFWALSRPAPRNQYRVNFVCYLLSCVWLFVTPWTVASQAPLSMEFWRPEYWSGLSFPSPGDLPNPGIKPGSRAVQADSLLSGPPGKSHKTNLEYTQFLRFCSSRPTLSTKIYFSKDSPEKWHE